MSALLDKETVTVDTEAGDHDRFAHFFKKADLEAAWLEGKEIVAICGSKTIPNRDPQKYPLCGTCKDILEGLPE